MTFIRNKLIVLCTWLEDFYSFAIRNVIEGRIYKLFNCRFLWKNEPYILGSGQIIFGAMPFLIDQIKY